LPIGYEALLFGDCKKPVGGSRRKNGAALLLELNPGSLRRRISK
jgi:hypothetical protein